MYRPPGPLTILCAGAALLVTGSAAGELCSAWSAPEPAGALDIGLLPEASGFSVSSDGDRLYLINDGTTAAFFVSALDGSGTTRVGVRGFRPRDMEDIAVGPCGTGRCLFLADIGDNAGRRDTVQIALVDERAGYGSDTDVRRVVTARYPDGARDAEALAVDANGDVWILSKSALGRPAPAGLFRLTAAAIETGGEPEFERVGELPLGSMSQTGNSRRRVVTAMDIAPDGRRLAVLTYDLAFEIAFDSAAPLPADGSWRAGLTHREIATAPLIQAEAMAYADGGRSILYTTESIAGSAAPIFRQTCR